MLAEIEALRTRVFKAEQEQEALEHVLQERQYALAKGRHRQTAVGMQRAQS
jgi:hypothetical protein